MLGMSEQSKILLLGALLCCSMSAAGIDAPPAVASEAQSLTMTLPSMASSVATDEVNRPVMGDFARALRTTLAHNPAVKGKQAELEEQTYQVDSAKAKRYPSFTAQANNVNDNYDQGTLRVDQTLWAFGKIDAEIDQANVNVRAEQWSLLQVKRQLIEETAVSYAKIEGIKQRLQEAQRNRDEHQHLHQKIERRQKGQMASEADTRLAYSRLLQAQAQTQGIKGELMVAETELLALTQVPVSSNESISPDLGLLPLYSEVEQLAIQQSANLQFKRLRLEVVRLEGKREKASSLPTLYFRVEHDALDHAPGVDRTRTGLVIESSLEGMGFVARGRVKGAAARLRAAKYDLDTALNDVRRRVNVLMLNRQVQNNLYQSQTLTVEAVEATMASFLRQYKTGRKTWVEVLNTQRELTDHRLRLVQLKSDGLMLSLRVAAIIGALDLQAGLQAL